MTEVQSGITLGMESISVELGMEHGFMFGAGQYLSRSYNLNTI